MKLYRIVAILSRNFRMIPRDMYRLVDLLYWPSIDIISWGFTGVGLSQSNPNAALALLTCLVCWQVTYRNNLDISVSILDELWAKNIVNFFASPLTLCEWIITVMIFGFIRTWWALFFGSFMVWLIFGFNILSVSLIPCILLFVLSGWWMGFFTSSFLIYFGQRIQMLCWVVGWLFAPVSGIFCPVEALPAWAQNIAAFLPTAYANQAVRKHIATGILDPVLLTKSLILNLIYLVLTIIIFTIAFEKSKEKGLSRLQEMS